MLETDSTPDRWINFVLQNGWRLNARVDEETGELMVSISNENGIVDLGGTEGEIEVKEIYKLWNENLDEESN